MGRRRGHLLGLAAALGVAALGVAALGVAGCSAALLQETVAPAEGHAASDRPIVVPDIPPLHPAVDPLDETVVTISPRAGEELQVAAKVAVTAAERQRGLMQVAVLPDGVGMLFVFDEDRTGGFWMRDTLVPLDIAYIASDGTIVTILSMEPCLADDPVDCEVYTPAGPYRTALEVPQGWFARAGVSEGAEVRWSRPVPASR